jgi:Tol biopolymer transport system component
LNCRFTSLLGLAILLGLLISSGPTALARTEPVKLTEEKEEFICPVFSPDGQSIAMTKDNWAGICRMNADGTGLEELTADRGAGYRLAWSPDGRHIAYRAEKMVDGKRFFAIKVVDVNDQTVLQLTEYRRSLGTPRWISGDGTIVFQTDRDGALEQVPAADLMPSETQKEPVSLVATTSKDLQVWVSQPDGSERTLVSDPDQRCFDAILSPDGYRVCYSVLAGGGSMAVAHTDGSHRTNLGYGNNPCWSPDGENLVYEITLDDGMVITGSDLYLIRADGSGKTQLTDTPGLIERWPNWSPDGTKIAFSAGGAIHVMTITSPTSSAE